MSEVYLTRRLGEEVANIDRAEKVRRGPIGCEPASISKSVSVPLGGASCPLLKTTSAPVLSAGVLAALSLALTLYAPLVVA
jgi:hypothetical protein